MNRYNHHLPVNGVLTNNGRVRDAGQYRDRTLKNRKYPNNREKIITGKELTTPLGRAARAGGLQAQRTKYMRAAKDRLRITHRVVSAKKKRLPTGAIFGLVIAFGILLLMICSYIAIHEKDARIAQLRNDITGEEMRERTLNRELEIKNDMNAIISHAVNELGMVKEDQLQRHYIASASDDKVIVLGERNNPITNFMNLMSAFFN
jgi:hypothetical protein